MVMIALLNHVLFAQQDLCLILGQHERATRVRNEVWFYLLVLVVAAFVIVAFGLVIRKHLDSPIESSDAEAVLDLSELRKLHRDGQLTDDEYLAARSAALIDSSTYLGDAEIPPAADANPHAPPSKNAGVELGPELLDTPQIPPTPPTDSDNPGPTPQADDPGPKD